MKAAKQLLVNVDSRGVATVSINRPQVHNAFDDELINHLISALQQLERDPEVKILVLCSEGDSFSAGADLNWMRRMANYNDSQNRADAEQLALLMQRLNNFNKPTIARVQGPAYGGAVGLIACCDIAIAATKAKFCFSEVRLGLIPAVISPYILKAIGERTCRRYFLTAEVFDAREALRIGLLHEVVDKTNLQSTVDARIKQILKAGPKALLAAKQLILTVSGHSISDSIINHTVECISDIRASNEAKEGITAFLKKTDPGWIRKPPDDS